MERDRSDVVDAFLRLLIQRFNIAKGVREVQASHANFVCSEAIEHEGVVRVGAVSYVDFANRSGDSTHKNNNSRTMLGGLPEFQSRDAACHSVLVATRLASVRRRRTSRLYNSFR